MLSPLAFRGALVAAVAALALTPAAATAAPAATATASITQSVAVSGYVKAGLLPATGSQVKLYDEDVTADDLLGEVTVDPVTGAFHVAGTHTKTSALSAFIKVRTKVGELLCWRAFRVDVPAGYVTEGSTPASVWDAGTFDVSTAQPGETRECTS